MTLHLTKFDVAERQLLQAIALFFSEADEVSIHTLSEAAGQVFYDIGKPEGVESFSRNSKLIRPERMKEWHEAVFSSRNFFKHADRDADKVHEFKPIFNDLSLIDSVNMHKELKTVWMPETFMFMVWFSVQYPDLLQDENTWKDKIEKLGASSGVDYRDKSQCARTIDTLRQNPQELAPAVSIESGRIGAAAKPT